MAVQSNGFSPHPIWDRIKKGDIRSVEQLYEQHSRDIYLYGLKYTGNSQLVEDCIQELFVRIIKNYENLNQTENPKAYLLKSFRNNLFRMMEREKKYSQEEVDDYQFELIFSSEQKLIDKEEDQRKKQILLQALKKLSARQGEAIYLRYTKGLHYQEIAEIMNMSMPSYRNIIYRAISSIRKEVADAEIILFFFIQPR